jgi:extracellular factor (EF) 3-hydroxypalmitic acid methyl ester biosynthesis protein
VGTGLSLGRCVVTDHAPEKTANTGDAYPSSTQKRKEQVNMTIVETAYSISELVGVADGFAALERSGLEDTQTGYHRVVSLVHQLCLNIELAEAAGYSRASIEGALEPVWELHSRSPFFYRMQTWPRGYPGDFETIEYLCEGTNGARPGTAEYFIEQHALTCGITQQHRNKVAWQASKVLETCLSSNEERRVLSIACGGSRDLRSIQSLLKATPGQLLLNDIDADALTHSVKSLPHLEGKLHPVPGNVFSAVRTLKALGPFDLVVAGGLFDYLSDRQIEWLLDKLAKGLKIGGRICFTNIALGNPYRPWMDYLTSWRLIERSEADFVTIIRGMDSDISMEVEISRDKTGLTHLVELTRIA